MITKYTNFILEKSSLNKIKLPQNVIKFLHHTFNIKNNVDPKPIKLISHYDFHLNGNLYIYTKNDKFYVIIDPMKKNVISYCLDNNLFETNIKITNIINDNSRLVDNDAILMQYNDNNLKISIINLEKIDLDTQIWEINYGDSNSSYNKFKPKINDEIYQIIENEWLNILTKLYSSYYNDLKNILKNTLNNIQKWDDFDLDFKYFKEIEADLKVLERFKDKNELLYTIRSYTNKFIEDLYYKLISEVNYNTSKLDFNNIAKQTIYQFYKQTNEYFNFKKYRKYKKIIDLDPTLWKQIEHNVFDKKLRDEFKHLINANKFDLI